MKSKKIQFLNKKVIIALLIIATTLVCLEFTDSNFKLSKLIKENVTILNKDKSIEVAASQNAYKSDTINVDELKSTYYINHSVTLYKKSADFKEGKNGKKIATNKNEATVYKVYNGNNEVAEVFNYLMSVRGYLGEVPSKYTISKDGYYEIKEIKNKSATKVSTIIIDTILPEFTKTPTVTKGNNQDYVTVCGYAKDSGKSGISISGIDSFAYNVDGERRVNNLKKSIDEETGLACFEYQAKKMSETYKIHFYVYDKAGNSNYTTVTIPALEKETQTTSGSIKVTSSGTTLDKTKPTISLFKNLNDENTYTKHSTTLQGTAADNVGLKGYMFSTNANLNTSAITWNKFEKVKGEFTATQEITENGTWYFYVADNSGNWTKSNGLVVKNIDKISPTIKVGSKSDTYKKESEEVTVTVNDSGSGLNRYAISQEIVSTLTNWKSFNKTNEETVKLNLDNNGTYYFYAEDKAGNISSKEIKVDKIDNTKPVISKFTVGSTKLTTAPLNVNIQLYDGESGLSGIQFNSAATPGKNWTNISGESYNKIETVSKNGIYYLHVKDNVGNIKSKSITVTNIVSKAQSENAHELKVDGKTGTIYVNKNFIPTTSRKDIRKVVLKDGSGKIVEGYWLGKKANVELDKDAYPDIKADDARETLRWSSSLEDKPVQEYSGDVNGNGEVTIDDADMILKASAGLKDPLEDFSNSEKLLPAIIKEGSYTLQLKALSSNKTEDFTYNFVLDKTKPEADLSAEWKNEKIIVTATAKDALSGIVKYQFADMMPDENKWTDINATTEKITKTYEISSEGELNDLYFYVEDKAGNRTSVNILNMSDIMTEENSSGTSDDDKSPEIVSFRYLGISKESDKLIVRFAVRATDDEKITGYQINESNEVKISDKGYISYNGEDGKVLEKEINLELNCNKVLVSNMKTDDEDYFYIKDTSSVNNNATNSVKIEKEEYYKIPNYYFYVKDNNGNYSIMRLFNDDGKDTQRPQIVYVDKSHKDKEKINSETLTIYATDFEDGSGLQAVSITNKKDSYNWEQTTPKGDKRTEYSYTKTITENGIWYIYVKDMNDNISLVSIISIDNIMPKVTKNDIELKYEEVLRVGDQIPATINEKTDKQYSAIVFESSDTEIATVDALGNVTGKAVGKVTIVSKIINFDGSYIEINNELTVLDQELKIVQNPEDYENIIVNDVPQIATYALRTSKETSKDVVMVQEDTKIELRVVVEGTGVTYQWYENSKESNEGGTKINGATSDVYTIDLNKIDITKEHYYYCVVSNMSKVDDSTIDPAIATITSDVVTVTIWTIPDKPTISVVDKYNNIIESGEYSNTEINISVNAKEKIKGIGTIGYKYSFDKDDEESWKIYNGTFEFDEEIDGVKSLYVKSYNENNPIVESEIETFDIIIDKERPNVKITSNVSNVTNKDEIELTFIWNERVEGFTTEDIELNNASKKGELSSAIKNDDGTYSYKMTITTNTEMGNVGEIKIFIEEDKCIDKVRKTNVRTESIIRVDKKAPILISLEAYAESTIELNSNVDTVKQYYKVGDTVKIVATFDETITSYEENITGLPKLILEFSDSGEGRGEVSGRLDGNKLIYTYTITDEDNGKLSVKGFTGKVVDSAGNETIVTKRTLDGDTIIADTKVPTLNELKVVSPEVYKAEQEITIEASFDEEIYAIENNVIKNIDSSNAPELKLKFGSGSEKTATAIGYGETAGKKDMTKIRYTYTIVDGDNGNLVITSYVNKQNNQVCDIAGNVVTLNTTQTGNTITADTIRPTVKNVTAVVENPTIGNTGIYHKAGNKIKITVTFSEIVKPEVLQPKIQVGFSENENKEPTTYKDKSYESDWNADSETVEYTYDIEDGDNGYLWIKVPENQFKDEAGNKNIAKEGTKLTNIYADTTIPTVTLYRDTEETQNNQTITVKARFNENVYDLNDDTRISLTKSNAPKLIYSFGTGKNQEVGASSINNEIITYTITKDSVKDNGDLHYELAKGNLCDRAGNELYKSSLDTTAPELEDVYITSDTAYGEYCKQGVNIKVIAEFNEDISNQKMEIKFKIGQGTEQTISGNIDNEDKTKIVFNYQVKAGDNGEFTILDVQGNTLDDEKLKDKTYGYVKDKHGNQKNIFNFDGVTIRGKAIADTIKPYIKKVEAKANDKVIASYTKEDGKDAITTVGKTNANEIEYVITFSELVNYKAGTQVYNGTIKDITNNDTNKDGYYDQVIIKVQPTIEGVQSLMVPYNTFEDRAGNENNAERFNLVTTDLTKPTIRFISEYNGGTYVMPTNIGKVEIRPNVEISEDIAMIEYKWDNSEYARIESYSTSSDIAVPTKTFTEAGTYILSIRATDLAGNVSESSKTYEVINSNINITLNKTEWTNQDITVTVEFGKGLTDNRKVTFRSEKTGETVQLNAIGTDTDGNPQYTITENGTLYAEATDRVGNKVFTEKLITNIDKEKPKVTIDLNGANLVIGTGKTTATIKSAVEAEDNEILELTKFAYIQKDIDITNISAEDKALIATNLNSEAKIENAISTKGKTPYYLYVLAKDKAGNETIEKAGPFTVLDTNERENVIEATETTEETKEIIPAEIAIEKLIAFTQKGKHIDIIYNNFGDNEEYLNIIREKEITLSNDEDGFIDYENYSYVDVNKPTTIKVVGKDACGNEVIATYEVKREMIEGPEFEVYGNPETWTNQDIKLDVYCNEELSALTVNGNDILANMYVIVTENGDYKFIATDVYGMTSEKTIKVTKIDKDNPVISKAEASGKTITITAEDVTSGVEKYAITDTTELPVEWSDSNVIKVTHDGEFYAWAMDKAGNYVRTSESITIDTTAPTITFNYTLLTVEAGLPINANIITDEEAKISYSWDKKAWETSEEFVTNVKVTKKYDTIGKYTLYAKATDRFGNESKIQTIEFSVEKLEEIQNPKIIFEDLPTMKVDGVYYVKVAADMTTESVTNKMDKKALSNVTPEYKGLTEDKKLKTGSEISLNGETKYIIIVNGDVNGDGKVGPVDVTYANSIRLNKVNANTIQKLAADFDLDGLIKPIDITMINSYRLGKIKGI